MERTPTTAAGDVMHRVKTVPNELNAAPAAAAVDVKVVTSSHALQVMLSETQREKMRGKQT